MNSFSACQVLRHLKPRRLITTLKSSVNVPHHEPVKGLLNLVWGAGNIGIIWFACEQHEIKYTN
jgi:hypothetical protein